jgi:deoxyribonuclease IV
MPKKIYYGAHASIAKGIVGALKTIKDSGGNIAQIFISNPQGKGTKIRTKDEINQIKTFQKDNNMKLVIHAPYVLNFAKPFESTNWWVKQLITELKIGAEMGSIGSVVHFGKHLKLTRKQGLINMKKSFEYIVDNTPNNATIILETAAGQGTELGYDLEEFAALYNSFSDKYKKKIKICIDTCHVFVAGYDLSSKKMVKSFFIKFNKLIGMKHVVLMHLNDSKPELGKRVDRHENIGKGNIGLLGLTEVIKYAKKKGIPLILETPAVKKAQDIKNEIKIIKDAI